eukprot:403339499
MQQEETVLLTESQIQESSMSESMMDELFDDKMKFSAQNRNIDSFACINDVGQTETCSILFNKRQQRFNVAVIGESGVGKTSVITRHIFSKFRGEYSSTIEDFYSTFIRLNQIDSCITTAASATNTAISLEQTLTNYKTSLDSNDNQMVRLDLIDTAGLEELKLVRASSLKACDGYIFIYDVNKIETLQKIDGFLEDLIKLHSTFEIDKIPLVIVGNKYDHEIILTEIYSEIDRVISTYKHQFKIQFLQCSAKRGIKIDEIFQKITLMMIKHGPTRKISKDYFYQEASMLLKEKSFIKSNGQSFQFKSHSLLKKKLSQRQKLQNFNVRTGCNSCLNPKGNQCNIF